MKGRPGKGNVHTVWANIFPTGRYLDRDFVDRESVVNTEYIRCDRPIRQSLHTAVSLLLCFVRYRLRSQGDIRPKIVFQIRVNRIPVNRIVGFTGITRTGSRIFFFVFDNSPVFSSYRCLNLPVRYLYIAGQKNSCI